MRDSRRILPITIRLQELWCLFPDLRFSQIFELIKAKSGKTDLFYVEDEEILKIMEKIISQNVD